MDQKRFRLNSKALFGMMVLAAAMPVHAATIAADPTAVDGVVGDTKCSLREAVIQVNAGIDSDDCKNFSADVYGTNDTITLPAGAYQLTVTGLDEDWDGIAPNFVVVNNPDASMGDIDILKSVRIVGAGADATTIQWDGAVTDADRDRIFHVFTTELAAVVDVEIEGVTIQGGRTSEVPLAKGAPSGDPADPALYDYYFRRAGAGLAVGAGANIAQVNPLLTGPEHSAGRGGSKRPDQPDEGGATFSLTLAGVKVLANQAEGDGAGIYTAYPMNATNIVVSGNSTTINGGGIYNEGNTSIINSTISDNIAEGGGGMFMTGSNTVSISGTTLSGNHAIGGGAISGRAGMTLNLVNSTLSGNIGTDVGAGLYTNGAANLNFVTIANNLAGSDSTTQGSGINVFPAQETVNSLTLKNVLLAGNKRGWTDGTDPATLASANCGRTGGGVPVTSLGNNLSSDDTCVNASNQWLTAATDKNNFDPKLAALADNGGPTLTHALAADSPALGAGAADPAVTTDQRGVTRETPPDIGAFELVTAAPIPTGGGGGGCAVGNDGRLDPTLPGMLAAALVFLGWRRRAAK